MSGTKAFAVAGVTQGSAGATGAGTTTAAIATATTAATAASTSGGVSGAAIAMGAATALGITALVAAAGVAVALTGKALQAYQERQRRQQAAREQREREVKQRIAEIRSKIRSRRPQSKVTVQLPVENRSPAPVTRPSTATATQRDEQRKIDEWRSRLPSIQSEYETLADQELLDRSTVDRALEKTKQALERNRLAEATGYLRALDDARIKVIQELRDEWLAQVEYIEQRLSQLRSRIPQAIATELQIDLDWAKNNWQQLTQSHLDSLHERISLFAAQADSIQQAAENMVESQQQVGYVAYVREIDNGDAIVEVETHEGVNTQIRLNFDGQQIALEGPQEEEASCAARTVEAMQIFQEQGYQLEWTEWDGEPVEEELRHLYSVPSETVSESEPQSGTRRDRSPQRRQQAEGY
ncbi:hypothetical protein [Roseofilum casamattae]|uniref:Uncharacterized protein n=1 Tax=Roseofilum casamattae BLCC-M143 TaxID=3022442 RepID=A0ABT7C377_9CYAN|nr:hypothetical protein [Roseofilum casamattae]MDJ1185881.1 hypothetical protein [Roseofilum casamattae BLCC-M143]